MTKEFIAPNGLLVISGQIQGLLASGIVLSGSIASGQVNNFKLSSGASIANLQSGNIRSGLLANNSVLSGNILSGNIGGLQFSPQSIRRNNFADSSVLSGSVASGQIGQFHLVGINGAGYFAGGGTLNQVATADKLTYSNDTTAAQTTANLSQARIGVAGVSNSTTQGYFAGGLTASTFLATADKITYTGDTTVAQTTANLSQSRSYLAGVSEIKSKGYFAGGSSGAGVATADKLTYTNDTTAAQTSANLTQARFYLAGIDGTLINGYFAGGNIPGSYAATADKVTYSTDTTAAQTTANLSQARDALAGCTGDSSKGYFAGGSTGFNPGFATADKLTYATDTTVAQTTANLSQAKYLHAGVSDGSSKGYFAGGTTGFVSAFVSATADKLTYATDTTAAQTTANISQARYGLAGVSRNSFYSFYSGHFGNSSILSGSIASGQIGGSHLSSGSIGSGNLTSNSVYGFATVGAATVGFFAGGNSGTSVTTAEQITYSTDTTAANTSANLTQARSVTGCTERGTKGYFISTIADKITYSTSTTNAQPSANLSQSRTPGSISDGLTKGFLAGGYTGSFVTTADKLIFPTDTTAAQATANLSQARGATGCAGNTEKGYFAGGLTALGVGADVLTADLTNYSTDTTTAQTSARLSQARYGLAATTEGNTKGYFFGGDTNDVSPAPGSYSVALADKIVYATDTTSSQTSANLSQARQSTGVSLISSKGYCGGGNSFNYVVTSDRIVYSTDTTAAQTSANLSQARNGHGGVDGGNGITYFNNIIGSGGVVSGTILSGSIGFNHLSHDIYNVDAKTNNFRLSVVSGLPVNSGNLTSQTTLYLVPYNGDSISLFNGSDWDVVSASGTSVSIATSTLASGSIYDVYCYNNNGVPALQFSPAWTNINARADAVFYTNAGVPLKSGTQTRRFVGTVWARNSGVIDDSRQYRGVWNWDNRVTTLLDTENQSGHTYVSTTPRPWNNNSGIAIYWLQGFGGLGAQASIFAGISRATGAAGTAAVVDAVSNAAYNVIQVVSFSSGTANIQYRHAAGWIQSIPGLNWMYVTESVNASGSIRGVDIRLNANVEA